MADVDDRANDRTVSRPSLRERKKAKTRRALVEVSQRLFAEQGYADTTLDQICAEIEIRPQTLLRYFESKAQLALAPEWAVARGFRAQLEAPNREQDTLTLWRAFVAEQAHELAALQVQPATWMAEDPVLVAMRLEVQQAYEDALTAGLAADRGVPADDLHSRLLAALLVAGNAALYRRWLERGSDRATLADNQLAVIDFAVEHLPARVARRLSAISD